MVGIAIPSKPCNIIKKDAMLWHRCFPVNLVKSLWTSFFRTPRGNCFFMSFDSTCKVFPGYQVRLCSSCFGFSWPYSLCLFLWFNEQRHSEPCQTSKLELFEKIVNDWKSFTFWKRFLTGLWIRLCWIKSKLLALACYMLK